MNILAVDPYYTGSHKAFLDGLRNNSRHTILTVTLDNTDRKWWLHGYSIDLTQLSQSVTEPIDLLLASSMTNLATYVALTNPRFAHVPKIMYMHENQITLPVPKGESRDWTLSYFNYLSMLTADVLVFNTHFHYQECIEALPRFLEHYGKGKHLNTIDEIKNKSRVLYPGLELKAFDQVPNLHRENGEFVIVWNQRWTFDRNPAKLFRVLNRLDDINLDFELILAGDNKHDKPEAFEHAWRRYGNRIKHFGYVGDFENYGKLLHQGDVVVSTSDYEFFCTPIMEAIYCGCHPILPNRLHYPELIPERLHKPLLHSPIMYDSEDELFSIFKNLLSNKTKCLPRPTLQSINRHMDWGEQIAAFDKLFETVAGEYLIDK